jgi:hypothetical protein
VRSDHHDLVAEGWVRARQLGDDVVAARVLRKIPALDVDANGDRHSIFQKTNEIIIMFAGDDDGRDGVGARVARL